MITIPTENNQADKISKILTQKLGNQVQFIAGYVSPPMGPYQDVWLKFENKIEQHCFLFWKWTSHKKYHTILVQRFNNQLTTNNPEIAKILDEEGESVILDTIYNLVRYTPNYGE